jgi:uncharacterized membrane protein
MELSRAFDYAFSIILLGVGTLIIFVVQMTPSSLMQMNSYVGATALVFGGLMIITGYLSFIITMKFRNLESILEDMKSLILVGDVHE